ncbi:hypothetical protein L204_105873 [Cryptococcus depauperatus]|nr:hypothetical protein L204_06144 [Cryptococcus depauperatus CBS 7855]
MPGRILPDIQSSDDPDLYSGWPPQSVLRPRSYAVRPPLNSSDFVTDGPLRPGDSQIASLTDQPSTDNPPVFLHNDLDWFLLDVEGGNGNDIYYRPDRTSGGTDFSIHFNLPEDRWIDDICTRGVTPLPNHRNQRESLQQAMNSRFTRATSEGRNGIEVDHPSISLMEESLKTVYRHVIRPDPNSTTDQ